MTKTKTDLLEKDYPTILSKFFAGESYKKEDLKKCTKQLLSKYNYQSSQLQILSEDEIDDIGSKAPKKKKHFYIYGSSKWVFFYINTEEEDVKIFYKDPTEQGVLAALQTKFEELYPSPTIITSWSDEQEVKDAHLTGPLALRYFRSTLEELKKDSELSEFEDLHFTTPEDLNKEKLDYVKSLSKDFSDQKDFKTDLKSFLKILSGDCENKKDKTEEEQFLELSKNHSGEVAKLLTIFNLFDYCDKDDDFNSTFDTVSKKLSVNSDKLDTLYSANYHKNLILWMEQGSSSSFGKELLFIIPAIIVVICLFAFVLNM